jgi:hypothetical protein
MSARAYALLAILLIQVDVKPAEPVARPTTPTTIVKATRT